jgi:hypothetical protein
MKDHIHAAARSFGFSRPRPSRASHVPIEPPRAPGDAHRCLFCDSATHTWLVSATGAAVCEACAVDAHPIVEDADCCDFCASPKSPIRGRAGHAICEACLSFSRAIVLGDV